MLAIRFYIRLAKALLLAAAITFVFMFGLSLLYLVIFAPLQFIFNNTRHEQTLMAIEGVYGAAFITLGGIAFILLLPAAWEVVKHDEKKK